LAQAAFEVADRGLRPAAAAAPAIPAILHFTVPAKTSALQDRAIERARRLHPGWRVVVWQDPIAREAFELAPLWDRANSGAQLADLVRLEVVHRLGGIYVDSDLLLERALDPLRRYGFFVASEDGTVPTNAVFGATPGHPALRRLIDAIARDAHLDWRLEPVHTTGPGFFARELAGRTDVTVLPRATFYPYNWNERAARPHRHGYGVHLWAKSWAHVRGPAAPAARGFAGTLVDAAARAKRRLDFNEFAIRLRRRRVGAYPAEGVVGVRTIHGFTILLRGDDRELAPQLALDGYRRLRTELFLRAIVRGGDWAIDAGAGVGHCACLLAQQVGEWGRVFAYEREPQHRELASRSLALNGFAGRVVRRPAAAGSLDGDFPVDLPIRCLRIDAGESAHDVVAGAQRLLERGCIDFVLAEAPAPRTARALAERGYRPHRIRADLALAPLGPAACLRPDRGDDLVFAPQ
jgi:hypothetical protein